MKKKCLLVKMKDQRKFFTYPKYYKELVEFSNSFGVELSIIKADNPVILSLNELAPALCSPDVQYSASFKAEKPVKIIGARTSAAQRIRQYVRETFLKKEIVTLQTTAKKFKEENLTLACFCQHIAKVRDSLTQEGYKIVKIGGGKYQMTTPNPKVVV